MKHEVLMSRRVQKQVERVPESTRKRLVALVEQLQERGPVQPGWPHYGRLSPIGTTATCRVTGWHAGTAKGARSG
jgi:mRNA-degrading endonuclease RelE of RelBE toxin-antitoxin system